MDENKVSGILRDTAYVRISGSAEERECAAYLQAMCRELGLCARLETFPVPVYRTDGDSLVVNGEEIPCRGYYGCGCGRAEAALYYLGCREPAAMERCRDRIVLLDGAMSRDCYDALVDHGARGIITYSGTPHLPDRDIARKWLDFDTEAARRIPVVEVHACDGIRLAELSEGLAEIALSHTEGVGRSQNVVLDLEGETEETVVVSAHYDSTPLSPGAYDNMSGCIALLYLAEYFAARPRRRRIRLLWCGSEEPGLLGSLAYCRDNADSLKNVVLNINLDMLGCTMGEFVAFSCADEEMAAYLRSFLDARHFPAGVRFGIRSSDSNSFVHSEIPAVSFARYAPAGLAPIHTRYDTAAVLSVKRILEDSGIIAAFTEEMANACPVPGGVSDKIRSDVADYMKRRPRPVGADANGGER